MLLLLLLLLRLLFCTSRSTWICGYLPVVAFLPCAHVCVCVCLCVCLNDGGSSFELGRDVLRRLQSDVVSLKYRQYPPIVSSAPVTRGRIALFQACVSVREKRRRLLGCCQRRQRALRADLAVSYRRHSPSLARACLCLCLCLCSRSSAVTFCPFVLCPEAHGCKPRDEDFRRLQVRGVLADGGSDIQ